MKYIAMNRILILSVLILYTFSSCKKVSSNDLKDDVPYYQSYFIDYDIDLNSTSASSKFKVRKHSGVAIKLEGKASVTANNIKGKTKSIDPNSYVWEFTGLLDIEFLLTKPSDEKFRNNVKVQELGKFKFGNNFPTEYPHGQSFTFSLEGANHPNGVSFNLQVHGNDEDGEIISFSKEVSNNNVTLKQKELRDFKKGKKITLTLTKRLMSRELNSSDKSAGGGLTISMKAQKELLLK